ncbi:MAG: TIGR03960 family B12-binding radical SAM protein [Lachnospiraceae bacterium]|nr:TIGR03960 family B12-binding radical SAM protein [Lachnospiraceae bacterium]
MRKLALPHDVLMRVEKPARYLGNEINAVQKTPLDDTVRFCMCFPDVYEVGMSHLGLPIIYDMLNRREDVWCERVYSPWPDLDAIMREREIPLFALESQDPVRCFDFLGITLQYEMCYTNILQILELSGIPLFAAGRTDKDPIVIGGGPCAYNPEPIADFFDLFYIGEGEVSYDELIDLYKSCKVSGKKREQFIKEASKIPGIYAPSLYKVTYNEDGTVKSYEATGGAPDKVRKVVVTDFAAAPYPEKPIIPYIKPVQDRVVLEIMRGCIRGCRFCQAGSVYKPQREKDLEQMLALARRLLDTTGHEEICLSSLSTSDYSRLEPLIRSLIKECNRRKINISLPSLRIDEFSLDVMKLLLDVRKSSVTFAPEAGSQRLRNVINKGLTEEEILDGAGSAFEAGWNKVKLYFMVGQPTETDEDLTAIVELCEKIAKRYYEDIPKEKRNGKIQINASSSFFVPKPFTPFQWASMQNEEEYLRRAYLVKDSFRATLNHKSLHYQYNDAKTSILEGVLARGDRRLSQVIYQAYKNGAIFDAWTEYFDFEKWRAAFEECGVDIAFYTERMRSADEVFPWDFIDTGVTKSFLLSEWEKAGMAVTTENCRRECAGCGAARFKGGICFESKNQI